MHQIHTVLDSEWISSHLSMRMGEEIDSSESKKKKKSTVPGISKEQKNMYSLFTREALLLTLNNTVL